MFAPRWFVTSLVLGFDCILMCNTQVSDSRTNLEGFSQLIRLLCWCPAYISTPDAMETGIYIWTWLVSAAPSLGPLVLAELVDAWLWTMDTKRGLFASDMKYCGPDAKLRPHLIPGEPEAPPEKDPVEAIIAHRLWLGFFIDRFEVITRLFHCLPCDFSTVLFFACLRCCACNQTPLVLMLQLLNLV